MKILVFPPTGGLGHYRTACVPAQPLTAQAAEDLVADLAKRDIYISITLGRRVQLDALTPLTTAQEVYALAAISAKTDSPLAWHGAVAT
jgi:hypothetical protein